MPVQHTRLIVAACLLAVTVAFCSLGLLPAGSAAAFSWTRTVAGGFEDAGNTSVGAMAFYGGSDRWQPELDLSPVDPREFQR